MTVPPERQGVNFVHDQLPGRVVFGAGRRLEAPQELESLGASRVLVIGGSHDATTVDELVDRLAMPTETMIGVRPHVPADTVRATLETFDRFRPDTVVTIGGGSATGLGKMVVLERDVDLLAIPTTYAGSEMTPIWGTTDDGVKQTGRSPRVLPRTVIYDPGLTTGLPLGVTVNSAFNALAHCLEALWLPGTSPIAVETAVSAVAAIIGSVEAVASQLDDIIARSQLLYGAHRAGSVLASAEMGLLHQTAHVLGGMFDLDHGAMYAVLIPPMIDHHLSTTPESRSRLADALGPDPHGVLHDLADRLGTPRSLAEIGFPIGRTSDAIDAVAQRAGAPVEEITSVFTAALSFPPEKETP